MSEYPMGIHVSFILIAFLCVPANAYEFDYHDYPPFEGIHPKAMWSSYRMMWELSVFKNDSDPEYLEPFTPLAKSDLKNFHVENRKLYEHLLHNYTQEIPPFYTVAYSPIAPYHLKRVHPNRVAMRLVYFKLINLLQTEQIVRMLIELRIFWKDERLEWNPEEFGYIDHMYISRQKVWTPSLKVLNSISVASTMSYPMDVVRVNYTGDMLWEMGFTTSNVCEMMTNFFPFDLQTCTICLMDENYFLREQWVAGSFTNRLLETLDSSGNGEWQVECLESLPYGLYNFEVLRMKRDNKEGHCYTFYLRRNSKFYVMVVIIPTFVITALSITGIFAKRIKGDDYIGELSLGLTSMMTMTVMLGIVAEALPKTSKLPVLTIFLTVDVVLMALSVLFVILYPKFERKKPQGLETRNRRYRAFYAVYACCTPNVIFMIVMHSVNVWNLAMILRYWINPPQVYKSACGKRYMERYYSPSSFEPNQWISGAV